MPAEQLLGLRRGHRTSHWLTLAKPALPVRPQSSERKRCSKVGISLHFPYLWATLASFRIFISDNVA